MLLSHTLYTNVNGISDVVDKVRQFAVSVGWTLEEHTTGKVWGVPKDYSGSYSCQQDRDVETDVNGAYLCLSSTGQGGTQTLIAKLEVGNYIQDEWRSSDYRLFCNMCNSKNYVDNHELNPVIQNSVLYETDESSYRSTGMHIAGVSLPHNASIPELWMFGNSHWVCGVVLVNDVFCTMFHFGSFEMFDSSPTQGEVAGHTIITYGEGYGNDKPGYNSSYIGTWDDYLRNIPNNFWGAFSTTKVVAGNYCNWSSSVPMNMRYDGRRVSDSFSDANGLNLLKYTLMLGTLCDQHADAPNNYLIYDKSLTKHTANNRKPMAKNVYYSPRASDEVYEPVCQTPCYFMSSTGLAFSQILDYAGEKYMVFPMITKANDWAVAFRIL